MDDVHFYIAIEDFTGLTDFSLQLFDDSDESCVRVTIVKDDIPEGNETFNITLIKEDLVEPNVELPNPQITILILGDGTYTKLLPIQGVKSHNNSLLTEVDEPVPDCDSNARRVETQCICNSGYTGDGLTCTGIYKNSLNVTEITPHLNLQISMSVQLVQTTAMPMLGASTQQGATAASADQATPAMDSYAEVSEGNGKYNVAWFKQSRI